MQPSAIRGTRPDWSAADETSTRLPAPPSRRPRVLLTGATGFIASQLLAVFRARYDLRLVDVRTTTARGAAVECVQIADLLAGDDDILRPLFEGVDAVVHLGYYQPPHLAGAGPSGEDRSYLDIRPNVDMLERVYRFSLDAGVRRVIVASSNQAAMWYEPLLHSGRLDVLDSSAPAKAPDYYGWSKIAGEALGFTYACGAFGRQLGVVQLRIGAPRELDGSQFHGRPAHYKRELGAYCSARDLQQLFVRAVETERVEDEFGVPFQIFYGISNNTRAFWSIVNARRVLGYEPQDDSEVRFAADVQRLLIEPQSTGRLDESGALFYRAALPVAAARHS
jgi:NAD+ dependent glucose-6-phosphate dehydrogenase